MGDWEPDRQVVVEAPDKPVGLKKESTLHLWVVPARIAGYWRGTLRGPGGEEAVMIEFVQRFQRASASVWLRRGALTGNVRIRGKSMTLDLNPSPWMPGTDHLKFALRVAQGRIEGEATDGDRRYVLRATRLLE
jgi:hypothetical protein